MGGEHQDVFPTTLTPAEKEALGEKIAQHAAHLDAAAHRLLTDIRTFDKSGGWYAQGAASCAAWLSWRVGWTAGTAREHVRVASRLAVLPAIDDALRKGELSYCKVRALTRVATPQNEAELVTDARYSTGNQLEQICRKYASVLRRHRRNLRDDVANRRVTRRELDDGMVEIKAVLHPEEALVVWESMNRVARELSAHANTPRTDRPHAGKNDGDTSSGSESTPDDGMAIAKSEHAEGTPRAQAKPSLPKRFCRADALVQMSDNVVRGTSPDRTPTEIVITVAADALNQLNPDALPIASASDGTLLSIDTVRRLSCDAGIVVMAEDANGTTLGVGRRSRSAPSWLKRALYKRDKKCQFPGCENHLFLDVHHCVHWANGGATDITNALLVCKFHHPFTHEYGYNVTLDENQKPVFTDSRGRILLATPPLPTSRGMADVRRLNSGLDITANTNHPKWNGEHVDYGLIVDGLLRLDGHI